MHRELRHAKKFANVLLTEIEPYPSEVPTHGDDKCPAAKVEHLPNWELPCAYIDGCIIGKQLYFRFYSAR